MVRHSLITAAVALATLAVPAFGGDMLQPGMPFPEFTLTAQDGSTVSSEALHGSYYLVYFYPKANTPGCTKEACAFRDSWPAVEAAGLKVFGVSYDTPKANLAFAEKYHLPFLLLSDTDHALAKQVGAARAVLPVPKRISYLVGPDGKVVKAYPDVTPASHAEEVLADYTKLTK